MALHLVVNNDERFNYLGDLLRAITWPTVAGPLPEDLAALILDIDEATVEQDISQALGIRKAPGHC